MGLVGLQENGNGEMGLVSGAKNKYKRMDSELTDFDDDVDEATQNHHIQLERSKTTRKYVFACAIFASLNSVLLGYGNFISFSIKLITVYNMYDYNRNI